MSTAIVKFNHVDRRIGVGDPLTDAGAALAQAMIALQAGVASLPANDLLTSQLSTQVAAVATALGGYIAQVGALETSLAATQHQLELCQAAQATPTTPVGAATTTPTAGVSPSAASFIAVGSALLGGVAGYAVRGKMKR
jgi:hypothetical protein